MTKENVSVDWEAVMKGRLEASFGRAFGFRVWGQTGFIRIYNRVQGSIIRVPPPRVARRRVMRELKSRFRVETFRRPPKP